MFKKLLFTLFLCCSLFAKAQVIDIETQPYVNLGKKTGFYVDQSTKLTIEEVLEHDFRGKFKLGLTDIYNKNVSGDAHWIRLVYRTARSSLSYVVFDQANIDTIKLYYRENGKFNELLSGSHYPLSTKAVKSTNFTFELPSSNSIDTLYARITGENAIVIPLKVVNGKKLPSILVALHSLEAIYMGVFLSFFFFNIFLFFSVGDKSVLAYSFYILFVGLFCMLALRGYSHLLGDEVKNFVSHYGFSFAAVGSIFGIAFTKLFLQLKYYSKILCRLLTVAHVLWGVQLAVTLFGYRSLATSMMQVLTLITTFLIIIAGITAIVKGFHPARKYVFAFILFLFSTFYTVLTFYDVFPMKDVTLQIMSIGSTLEIIFLSFALAERIKILRKEKTLAEQTNAKLISERNDFLEHAVAEKTEALQLALANLQTSNEMKDKLFNIVIHDMRSPLSNLIGLLDLKEGDMISDEELKNYVGETRSQVGTLQDRLSNLLLWSYTQMENKQTQPEWVDMKLFFEEQTKMYDRLMAAKNINFEIRLNEGDKVWVESGSLAVIVRNLLDNAVKYTEDHGEIKMGMTQIENGIKIFVTNSGTISLEKIEEILLTDSVKVAQSVKRGIGLGMVLCKEFAIRMHTELKVECKDGMTEFYICIPEKK